jgi:deoxyribodipyrimidine photolyase-related protein
MTVGIWVLGDQLWQGQAALAAMAEERAATPVLMIESRHHARQRRYHQQKLVLVWSAMRHFAEELKAANWSVTYEIAEDFDQPRQWIQAPTVDSGRGHYHAASDGTERSPLCRFPPVP